MLKPKPTTQFMLASLAILLLSAAWTWISRVPPGERGSTSVRVSAPQVGFLAPDFTLSSTDGISYTLSELRGRPVLVNLWASWCGPCRAEMPAIQRSFDAYKEAGFIVLAVNMTAQDSEAAAAGFAAEYHLDFPILLDLSGEVGRLYENRALPSSFFIDPEGIIQDVVIGGPMAEALLLTRVENLFGKGGP